MAAAAIFCVTVLIFPRVLQGCGSLCNYQGDVIDRPYCQNDRHVWTMAVDDLSQLKLY